MKRKDLSKIISVRGIDKAFIAVSKTDITIRKRHRIFLPRTAIKQATKINLIYFLPNFILVVEVSQNLT